MEIFATQVDVGGEKVHCGNVKPQERPRRAVHGNIKRLRKELGMTQAQLGEKVDADNSVVSHWERGESAPASHRLPRVAAALGVTVDALLTEHTPRRTVQQKAPRNLARRAS